MSTLHAKMVASQRNTAVNQTLIAQQHSAGLNKFKDYSLLKDGHYFEMERKDNDAARVG